MGYSRGYSKEVQITKLFLFLLIQINVTLASPPTISNLIEPKVSFSGRGFELEMISKSLNKYKKFSLIGFSGIGKTQLSRMYAFKNKEQYDIIWFFDCNINLDRQFSKLAQEINKLFYNGDKILPEDSKAKNEVLNYVKHKNKVLLVFDNLKIGQNQTIYEFIDLEHNIHILFCSQDTKRLPHITRLRNLPYEDSKKMLDKILTEHSENAKIELNNILKGYPILISQAAYLLNDNKYLTVEDYKENFYDNENAIGTHIKSVLKNLSNSAKTLLNKLVLINNTFSKDVIDRINENNSIKEIEELIRFGLINNVNISNNNNLFEIHDIIKDNLIKTINREKITSIIESIIISIHKSLPERSLYRYKLFLEDNTLLNSIEELEKNALNYNIDFFKVISLTRHRLLFYIFARYPLILNNIQEWFESANMNINNLEKRDILKLISYSECIFFLGLNDFIFNENLEKARKQLELAKEVIETIPEEINLKSNIYGQLSQYYLDIGNLDFADQNLKKMILLKKQFPSKNLSSRLDYLMLSKVFLNKGQYEEALVAVKDCMGLPEYKNLSNDVFLAGTQILIAKIYNRMKEYEKAKKISLKIYNQKNLKDKNNLMSQTLIELSTSELGLEKDLRLALQYAREAKNILVKEQKSSMMSSDNQELARTIFAEANAIFMQGDSENAIKKYLVTENIFYNKYKSNIKNIDDVSYFYYIAALNCEKIGSDLWFYKFRDMHLKYFGIKNKRSAELMSL